MNNKLLNGWWMVLPKEYSFLKNKNIKEIFLSGQSLDQISLEDDSNRYWMLKST